MLFTARNSLLIKLIKIINMCNIGIDTGLGKNKNNHSKIVNKYINIRIYTLANIYKVDLCLNSRWTADGQYNKL